MHKHPPIIVISGAIGSGKGTVVHALAKELDVAWIPTHTTRPVRPDDHLLSNRIFDTEATFMRHLARGEFFESVQKAGYRYGLLKHDIEKVLNSGKPGIIEVDVEGGMRLAKHYKDVLLIFILAHEDHRRNRIPHRSTDNKVVEARMREGREEEKVAREHYDYLIENPEDSPHEIIEVIKEKIREHYPEIHDRED